MDRLVEPCSIVKTLLEEPVCLRAKQMESPLAGIDLWWMQLSDVPTEVLDHPKRLKMLTREELMRSQSFRYRKGRDVFLMKRLLVRGVLAARLKLKPAEIEFTLNSFGRPEMRFGDDSQDVSFSVASAGDCVVCAVTHGRVVGIDVEDEPGPEILEIADAVLGDGERVHFLSMAGVERCEYLYRAWTLKEAYLKAVGVGLNVAPDRVQFTRTEGRITIEVAEDLEDEPLAWAFAQFQLAGRYVVALAGGPTRLQGNRAEKSWAGPLRRP